MALIKLSEFDQNKHYFEGYFSRKGIHIGSPTLRKNISVEGKFLVMPESKISDLQKELEKDPKIKAHFAIYSGRLGGVGNRWYRLSNVQVEVSFKEGI